MNPARVILAALVGGIIVFGWGYVSHELLPIGEMGVKTTLPGEQVVVPVLKASITEPGFYMFPSVDKNAGEAEKKAWEEKYKAGPHGIIVFHPQGEELNMVRLMGTEFVSNVLAALIGAVVLSMAGGSMGRRVGLGLALGLFAWLSVDVSYWNWYGFPQGMLVGSLIDQAVGWTAAGAVMGLVLGRPKVVVVAAV